MIVAGSHQREAWTQHVAIFGFPDLNRGNGVQPFRERAAERGRNVLNNTDAGEIAGQLAENLAQGLRPTGGGSE